MRYFIIQSISVLIVCLGFAFTQSKASLSTPEFSIFLQKPCSKTDCVKIKKQDKPDSKVENAEEREFVAIKKNNLFFDSN